MACKVISRSRYSHGCIRSKRLRMRARLAGLQVAENEKVVADLLHLRSARSSLWGSFGDKLPHPRGCVPMQTYF